MKKAFLFATLVTFTSVMHAQFLDKYGINIGAGLASQQWKYHLEGVEYNFDQSSMIGKSAVISCEKKMSRMLTIRPELGYMQKGFKSTRRLFINGEEVTSVHNKDVVLNDVVCNLGLKLVPMDRNLNPYMVFGIQADYLLSYKDVVYEDVGYKNIEMWKSVLDKFNKLSVGGIVAAGLEYRNKVYLEAVYIPAITSRCNKDGDRVRDVYVGLTLGVNVKYYPIKKIHTRHNWYSH